MNKLITICAALLLTLVFVSCKATKQLTPEERFTEKPGRKNATTSSGDDYPWFDPTGIKYDDWEYDPRIKSVKLYKEGIELSMPLLELGSAEKLQLIFDDLEGVYREYRYRVVHCDAWWNPSPLQPFEYIDGFDDGLITNFAFSQATRQSYVHYELVFPQVDMKFTRSGNYLMMVYDAGDPGKIMLTRRFMILEPRVKVIAAAKRSSVVEESTFRQEIDFEIDKGALQIDNPYNDLIVMIQQNGRWDNAVRDIKPRLVSGSKLSYDWERINAFDGTNEFRYFDLRSLSRITPRIAMIEQDSAFHQVYIKPDFKRAFQVYIEDKDLNGEYVISNDDALSNDYTEADYAWVHFTFPFQSSFSHGAIYLYGALTNWQFQPEAKMKYNDARSTYEASLYLKQGYYNYHYVVLDNAATVANTELTEGDHYETENFYTIWVYYRQPGTVYDQLIAVERIIAPRQP